MPFRRFITSFGFWPALLLALFVVSNVSPAAATSGINERLNYQARLLDSTGAVVPDGTYNMEFKIYQDGDGVLGGGDETLKWTETRTSGDKVTVTSGYFSVQLGSVTAFGSSVDWNQDTLWLSLNIGGTGSPSWDGEMTPFRRLAASAYSLNAKQLGGLDWSKFVQIAPSAVQTDTSALATLFLNKNNASGNILQLQKSGSDVLVVSNSGLTTFSTDVDFALSGTENLNITNTVTGTSALDLLFVTLTNQTSSGSQRGIVIDNANDSADATTDALISLINSEGAVNTLTDGLIISGTAGGGAKTIVDAIDVSDDNITNGINIGSNYLVIGGDSINEFVGNAALAISGFALIVDSVTTGTTATTSSNSGLEIGSDGLRLLGGCTSGSTDILKWNGSAWACAADAGGGGSLQVSYNTGSSIETSTSAPILFTETTAESHSANILNLTGNPATGGTFSGDVLQITMDAVDANAFTGKGLEIVVDTNAVDPASLPFSIVDEVGTSIFSIDKVGALSFGDIDGDNDVHITTVGGTIYQDINIKPGLVTGAADGGGILVIGGETTNSGSAAGDILIQGGKASGATGGSGGNIDIVAGQASGASGTRNGGTITISAGDGATTDGSIIIGAANTAAVTIDSAGVLELNSSGGVISIGNDAVSQNINLGTAGARAISIGNTTANTAVTLTSGGTGDVTLSPADDLLFSLGDDSTTTFAAGSTYIFDAIANDNTLDFQSAGGGVVAIRIDNALADTSGGVHNGLYLDYQITNTADSNAMTLTGFKFDFTNSEANAGDAIHAFNITNTDDAANGTTDALLVLNNAETTANTVTNYLLITASPTDTTAVALNVADADLGVALSIGANDIATAGGNGVTVTCSGGQFLQNQVTQSGITIGGSCAAAGGDLDVTYDSDSDKELLIDSTTGLIFDMTTSGDFIIQDSNTTIATFGNTGDITLAPSGSGTMLFSSDDDSVVINAGTLTNSNGLQKINITLGDDAGVDTVAGLQVNVTSANTGDADILRAIQINNVTSPDSTVSEQAISIGTGWDTALTVQSGNIITSNLGIELTESDTNPSCSSGDYKIYADTSEGKIKKCQNGTASDLDTDTTGGSPDTATFTDTSPASLANNTTTKLFNDATEPSITPVSTSQTVLVSVYARAHGTSTSDSWASVRVVREDDGGSTSPACDGTDPQVGDPINLGFATNNATTNRSGGSATYIDSPSSTNAVYYSVCSESLTGGEALDTLTVALVVLGADYAENYYTTDDSITPGELVSVDSSLPAGVKKSSGAYDRNIVGIVSTQPGKVLDDKVGASYGRPVPVALAGRAPVKVSTQNGPVKVGDLLTSSSTPGVAMRATKAGQIVGQAMTAYSGQGVGQVFAFIKTDYANGASINELMEGFGLTGEQVSNSGALLQSLASATDQALTQQTLSDIVADRIVVGLELIAPHITTDEIALNSIKPATAQLINISGDVVIGGGLVVGKDVEFKGNAIFDSIATFIQNVVFKNDVNFEGRTTFNGQVVLSGNNGGFATVPIGEQRARVTFASKFVDVPVVSLTIKNGQFANYAYEDLSVDGFTIVLKDTAQNDIEFSWTALNVSSNHTPSQTN